MFIYKTAMSIFISSIKTLHQPMNEGNVVLQTEKFKDLPLSSLYRSSVDIW